MKTVRDNNEINWNKNQLWDGCLHAAIIHAIMTAHYPYTSNEHSWDGINYSIQDSSSIRGTITFHPSHFVAVFREDRSKRSYGEKSKELKIKDYFQDAPSEVLKIAKEECLQYILDEVDNEIQPVISTCIWEENGNFFSIDPLDTFLKEGGRILETQSLKLSEAKEIWMENYEMTEAQYQLSLSLFNRKVSNPSEKIIITLEEIKIIGSDDEFGIQESKICCQELGIFWE